MRDTRVTIEVRASLHLDAPWVPVASYTAKTFNIAYDEAQRMHKASQGTLDTRLIEQDDDIPTCTWVHTESHFLTHA